MRPSGKGRGFFKKTEKERVSLQLNLKTKKIKKESRRGVLLTKNIKKNEETVKKTEEKAKILKEALSKLN